MTPLDHLRVDLSAPLTAQLQTISASGEGIWLICCDGEPLYAYQLTADDAYKLADALADAREATSAV